MPILVPADVQYLARVLNGQVNGKAAGSCTSPLGSHNTWPEDLGCLG